MRQWKDSRKGAKARLYPKSNISFAIIQLRLSALA